MRQRLRPALDFEPREPGPLRVEVQRLSASRVLAMGVHGHRFFEMIYVESGSGTHRIGARTLTAHPGDLFLIAPGEVHEGAGLAGTDGFLVLFAADALHPGATDSNVFALPGELMLLSFLRPSGAPPGLLRVPRGQRARLVSRIEALRGELSARRLGAKEAARAHLQLLLIETARLAAEQLPGLRPQARPLLMKAFGFIEARYAQPISLRDVARAVGRTPSHLADLVRRETGRTVLDWIVERRMAEARRRLLETEMKVGEIAASVSYDDAAYFIRIFRRLHGMTPARWRAINR